MNNSVLEPAAEQAKVVFVVKLFLKGGGHRESFELR